MFAWFRPTWWLWCATLSGVVLLVAVSPSAHAQSRSETAYPEVLKTLKPAAGMCLIGDALQRGEGAKAATMAPDLSCGIATAALIPLLENPETLLADMRLPEGHGAFRISNAINMTEGQLRSRPYLREKTVVLIGAGKAERELYVACARLKEQGFKRVKVLRGGMAAWLADGHEVAGRAPGMDHLVRLTAAEMWQEARFDGNLVLVVPGRAAVRSELPHSVAIKDQHPETIGSALERRRKESGGATVAAVVLIADATTNSSRLQVLQRAVHPTPLLVYTGDAEALARYGAQRQAVWAARERGPKQAGCGL